MGKKEREKEREKEGGTKKREKDDVVDLPVDVVVEVVLEVIVFGLVVAGEPSGGLSTDYWFRGPRQGMALGSLAWSPAPRAFSSPDLGLCRRLIGTSGQRG